jgi:hypothetical protein
MNQIPESAKILSIRPLNKGMVLNLPSQVIPDEACLDAANLVVNEAGLTRRGALALWNTYPVPSELFASTGTSIVKDIISAWQSDGDERVLVQTDKEVFIAAKSIAYARIPALVTAIACTVVDGGGGAATVTSTAAFAQAQVGDIAYLKYTKAASPDLYVACPITTVTSANIAVVSGWALPGVGYAASTCMLYFSFGGHVNAAVDWTIVDDSVVFASSNRPLIEYNPDNTYMSNWVNDPAYMLPGSVPFTTSCIAFHQERLWVGSTIDATDGTKQYRIRWSTMANHRDFSTTTAYLDLPYTKGRMLRLVPMGNRLVAYFTDAIYVGTPTNYPLLPLRFEKIDTAGVGLVGAKAVTSFMGAHFFVGTDDIYLFSDGGMERIGTPIIRRALANRTGFIDETYVTVDVENYCVMMTIPSSASPSGEVWRYQYKAKAWSYDRVFTPFLSNPLIANATAWDAIAGTWADQAVNWNQYNPGGSRNAVYTQRGSYVYVYSNSEILDYGEEGFTIEWITKDYDFGAPDSIKTAVRFNLKLEGYALSHQYPLPFLLQVSADRGRTWKSLPVFFIAVDHDEGYVNFRLTGSTFRFRVTSNMGTPSYTISEFGIRVRLAGEELTANLQGAH